MTGFFLMNFVFEKLTPERFLPALEEALSCELSGFASAFHSYINRVYELRTTGGEPLVVKFYRPGRWSADALQDEHDYLWECSDSGLPVVPPYELATGSTLGEFDGIYFAVFPKKRGRDVAFDSPEELEQAGRLIGRLHAVGARRVAEYRLTLEPEKMIGSVIERLADSAFPGRRQFEEFVGLCNEIADIACPTLGEFDGIYFAVFPKKRGRDVAFDSPEELEQAGRLIGRLHAVGARRVAEYRLTLEPEKMIGSVIERLADSAFPGRRQFEEFVGLCNEIADIACPVFPDASTFLRLHGDLHRANILSRPDEGLILIDFDDMLNGPPVQDLWLLLPDVPSHCPEEAEALARGYNMFMEFSESGYAVTECLRMLRMLYFLSWVAMQRNDPQFSATFPGWGGEAFWRSEFADLRRQIPSMKEEIRFWKRNI